MRVPHVLLFHTIVNSFFLGNYGINNVSVAVFAVSVFSSCYSHRIETEEHFESHSLHFIFSWIVLCSLFPHISRSREMISSSLVVFSHFSPRFLDLLHFEFSGHRMFCDILHQNHDMFLFHRLGVPKFEHRLGAVM